MIKCLYLEISKRNYCFLFGREEGRVKIFLLEISGQNLNFRPQHFSCGWVANPRSSPFNLQNPRSPETSVHTPHQQTQVSPHRSAGCLCFSAPPQGTPPLLNYHPPTQVIEHVPLCFVPPSPGRTGVPPSHMDSSFSFIWSPCNISPWNKKARCGSIAFHKSGKTYKLAFCSSHDFRFIAHSYINPHKSVEGFKAARPCDTSEKIRLHTLAVSLFQPLPSQRTFPKFMIVLLGCEKWSLTGVSQSGKVWPALSRMYL